MKLLRFGRPGREKPGLLDGDGRIRDLSDKIDDVTGAVLSPKSLDRLRRLAPDRLPLVKGRPRIGPCVAGVSKIVGVGLNYSDHAKETGMPAPAEPILFAKATTAITGPYDEVILPRGSRKTDWEVELGVVIGSTARAVSKAKALEHVAGYCVVNDLSERAYQLEGTGQWIKGKSCDSFAPIGPWLVTAEEVGNPQRLALWLDLNGKACQRGSSRTMIFDVKTLVSYISRHMTLLPGDIIATGTPPGVGAGMKPPLFLKPGDVMELGIDGLGSQRLSVVRAKR
jgi:2-keto-4-pentenoate hydratase/2-oxohepta-3-ene-1,7-dioic acid hydratase in catechol pathway